MRTWRPTAVGLVTLTLTIGGLSCAPSGGPGSPVPSDASVGPGCYLLDWPPGEPTARPLFSHLILTTADAELVDGSKAAPSDVVPYEVGLRFGGRAVPNAGQWGVTSEGAIVLLRPELSGGVTQLRLIHTDTGLAGLASGPRWGKPAPAPAPVAVRVYEGCD